MRACVRVCVCVCVCVGGGGGGGVRVQWCMGKKRGGGETERVELPNSLVYEAVLQSAGFTNLTNFLMFADVCLLCF